MLLLPMQQRRRRFQIERQLNERYRLSMDEYELLMQGSGSVKFGTCNVKLDFQIIPGVLASCLEKSRLYLEGIRDFHHL